MLCPCQEETYISDKSGGAVGRRAVFDQEPLVLKALSEALVDIPGVRITSGKISPDFQCPTDLHAELVVCDPSLGNRFEPKILREFRRFLPQPKILVLTDHREPDAIASALANGAQSIVLKSESPRTIQRAVELTQLGVAVFSQPIASHLIDNGYARTRQTEGMEASGRRLSSREYEVMHLVGEGKTDAEMAHELGASVRTIQRHVTNVLNKLNSHNRAEALTHLLTKDDAVSRGNWC